jgi:hypothetical protein
MFCPGCKCEFRPSFTRCASCDEDLVESLEGIEQKTPDVPVRGHEPVAAVHVSMAEVCGFLDLGEARQARDRLHQNGIPGEIVIRASPETPATGAVVEEFWLRADAKQIRQAVTLIDQEPEPADAGGSFKCSHCSHPVREQESFCASCGMRFTE